MQNPETLQTNIATLWRMQEVICSDDKADSMCLVVLLDPSFHFLRILARSRLYKQDSTSEAVT